MEARTVATEERIETTKDPAEAGRGYLDGKQLQVLEGPQGMLCLTIDGDRTYLRVKAARALPVTDPRHYISFLDSAGKEIGILRDLKELDGESRRLLEQALRARYLVAVISRVLSLTERYGVSIWKVETDRGEREFSIVDHGQNVRHLGQGRVSVQDVDGNRFEIPNYFDLDRKSFALIDRVI